MMLARGMHLAADFERPIKVRGDLAYDWTADPNTLDAALKAANTLLRALDPAADPLPIYTDKVSELSWTLIRVVADPQYAETLFCSRAAG